MDFDEYNEKQLILRVNCEMNLLRSVFWHSLVYPGRESFRLFRTSQGFEFNGQVVLTSEDNPFSVNYQVCCDALWYTRAVSIEVNEGYKSRKLQFDVGPLSKVVSFIQGVRAAVGMVGRFTKNKEEE